MCASTQQEAAQSAKSNCCNSAAGRGMPKLSRTSPQPPELPESTRTSGLPSKLPAPAPCHVLPAVTPCGLRKPRQPVLVLVLVLFSGLPLTQPLRRPVLQLCRWQSACWTTAPWWGCQAWSHQTHSWWGCRLQRASRHRGTWLLLVALCVSVGEVLVCFVGRGNRQALMPARLLLASM